MESNQIVLFIIGTATAIIGYFVKIVHNDVRKNTAENGKLRGKIDMVSQANDYKHQALQEMVQLEIKGLAINVGELSKTVEKLVNKIYEHN